MQPTGHTRHSPPQQALFVSALTDLRPLTSDFSALCFPLVPVATIPPAGGIENKFGMGILKSISRKNGRVPLGRLFEISKAIW